MHGRHGTAPACGRRRSAGLQILKTERFQVVFKEHRWVSLRDLRAYTPPERTASLLLAHEGILSLVGELT